MPTRLYTLTDISRKLGRDYRGIRDRESISKTPVAVIIIGGKEMKLYKLEQFGLQEAKGSATRQNKAIIA